MPRFIPEQADEQQITEAKLVVYRYQHHGRPAFIAYKGRQTKMFRHTAFTSVESREASVKRLVDSETQHEDRKRARKEASHGLYTGDIVYATWGSEQTNVDFYQVVRIPSGRSAVVREIKKELESDGPQTMTGYVTPCADQFADGSAEINRRTVEEHRLSDIGNSRGELVKWDGTPRRVSFYG